MPAELQELMRHEEISTTMNFYVGQNAEATVKKLRSALGATLCATGETAAYKPLKTQ